MRQKGIGVPRVASAYESAVSRAVIMSDTRNKAPKTPKTGAALDDPKLVRHERLTLFLFLEGAVANVAGMFLLSEFLSQGKADQKTLIIAGTLFGLLAVGIVATYLMRRRSDA